MVDLRLPRPDGPQGGHEGPAAGDGAEDGRNHLRGVPGPDERREEVRDHREAWLGGVLTQPRRRAPGMRSEAVRALSATWAAAAPPGVEAVEEGGASEELGAVVAGELPCDGGLDGPDGVVAAIACGAPDAPALRHGETAIFAFIERADGHHALFIDGQHVSCPADASRHVPLLRKRDRAEPPMTTGRISLVQDGAPTGKVHLHAQEPIATQLRSSKSTELLGLAYGGRPSRLRRSADLALFLLKTRKLCHILRYY